jgi:trehalose synthase-fused probable maltokinase
MNERDTKIEDRTAAEAVAMLTGSSLRDWLRVQRWSGAGGKEIESIAVADAFTIEPGTPAVVMAIVDVQFAREARPARMVVPMEISVGSASTDRVIGRVTVGGVELTARDAANDGVVAAALVRWMVRGERVPSAMAGTVRAQHDPLFMRAEQLGDEMNVQLLSGEQSNTSYVIDERWILKLLRRIEPGLHPEVVMLRQLAKAGFAECPRLGGVVTYKAGGSAGGEHVIAVLESFVPSRGDAWRVALDEIAAYVANGGDPNGSVAPYRKLGDVTAAMHLASARASDAAFAPEPSDEGDAEQFVKGIARHLDELNGSRFDLTCVRDLVARHDEIIGLAREAAFAVIPGLARIRVHGDLHLGQVLRTRDGYVVIDFEGEPMRPLKERHHRSYAARDVAGMLRSFDYAAAMATETLGLEHADAALRWSRAARERFLEGYLERIVRAPIALFPSEADVRTRALALFELEKALYEVLYEIRHRPALVSIPCAGVERALFALKGRALRVVHGTVPA